MLELFGVSVSLDPIWLTLEVAAWTTIILLLIGTPIAWYMARMQSRLKPFLEALVALPLVLRSTLRMLLVLLALTNNI